MSEAVVDVRPITFKKQTLVKGHTLSMEGQPVGYARNGPGQGICSCRQLSPVLPTNAARKRWHKQHKDEILAARG